MMTWDAQRCRRGAATCILCRRRAPQWGQHLFEVAFKFNYLILWIETTQTAKVSWVDHSIHIMLSDPVWSCLILSDFFWSCLMLSDQVWSCLILSGPVWSCLILSEPVWSCLVLSDPVWSYLIMSDTIWSKWIQTKTRLKFCIWFLVTSQFYEKNNIVKMQIFA